MRAPRAGVINNWAKNDINNLCHDCFYWLWLRTSEMYLVWNKLREALSLLFFASIVNDVRRKPQGVGIQSTVEKRAKRMPDIKVETTFLAKPDWSMQQKNIFEQIIFLGKKNCRNPKLINQVDLFERIF